MQCPEASELEEYLSGTASQPARAAIDRHLDGCDDCRQTLALLAPALPRSGTEPPLPRAPTGAEAPAAAPDPVEEPGDRISRYILGERLGAGAMGVVHEAVDPELHRNVAVKLMRGAWARRGGAAARARVIREARALARISHPNVIAVHDVGVEGDEVFIAMELVRGRNLRAHLRDTRPSLAEILELFSAAGQGLAAAHRAGVVHRDFKPDNVLVGEDGRVRVTDFGLALAAVPDDGTPESGIEPDPGMLVGTPAYMAPEQHAGDHVDPRSDQFSFCVALYEALYGERPFAGRTREEVAESARDGKVAPRPSASRVPGSLRAILLRGLAPDPADRFASMPALVRALGRDRGRAPRRAAAAAAVALALVLTALGADWVVRGRAASAARSSFAAARAQMSRLFELRSETFSVLANLSFFMPIMREVAAVQDQADFGLGEQADDRAYLEELHASLASADWITWIQSAQGADVAVADYKGRLLYASAGPRSWGGDVRAVAPVLEAYATASDEVRIAVVRGDDSGVVAAGLLGGQPRPGLRLLFSRLTVLGGRPRVLFAQMAPADRLLGEIAPGAGTRVSMVAPDGSAQGNVSPALLAAGLARSDIGEIEAGGERWLVQRHPVESPGSGRPIADIVLAHAAERGLAGLFEGARVVLGALAVALALGGIAAVWLARSRDLSRRPPRRLRARGRRARP
ncbi:MAG TPA: protein kinase [Kofleriaceae bacterium]|nr:protein kinase [Kofleriaceae bacterium]